MRRVSVIRSIIIGLIVSTILLTGCHSEKSTNSSEPDSSRDPYLSEVYLLRSNPAFTLSDVMVNRVFENIYDGGFDGDEYLVVDCTVEHSFFSGVKRDGDAEWIADGSPVFLWVNIGRDSVGRVRESAVELLRSLFEEADSVIVYGREFDPAVYRDSPDGSKFAEEIGSDHISYTEDTEGKDIIAFPSSVELCSFTSWELLPIIDGRFDADSMEEIASENHEFMSFDMNLKPTEGLRYFENGDTKETVYSALERYVNEAEKEEIVP